MYSKCLVMILAFCKILMALLTCLVWYESLCGMPLIKSNKANEIKKPKIVKS